MEISKRQAGEVEEKRRLVEVKEREIEELSRLLR